MDHDNLPHNTVGIHGEPWARFNNQNSVLMRLYNVRVRGGRERGCRDTGCVCVQKLLGRNINETQKAEFFGIMHESRIFYFENGEDEEKTEEKIEKVEKAILHLLTCAKYRVMGAA